jgi:hypothetical protein
VATATSTAAAVATPASTIALDQPTTSFYATGYEQQFTATETDYAGAFVASSSDCASIATFSPSTATSAPYAFAVTSVAAGTCHITIADSFGQSATETIVVTTTGGSIDTRTRSR